MTAMKRLLASLMLVSLLAGIATAARAEDKKIVMIAGQPSHGPGEHEHNAGLLLFQKCLANFPGIKVEEYAGGWPANSNALAGAAAIVIYSDGGDAHPALQEDHLWQIAAARAKGAGIACIHYAVEPTKESGQKEFLDWIGGCFEVNWSVNPTWEADFKQLPVHPITRGVIPFAIGDEWYYHMRFVDGMKGVTPILTALPTAETLSRPDGEHSGNPEVRKAVAAGEPQHVAWAYESPDGKRGFGFTGGHYHKNWGNDNLRKVMLNAILWVAKVDVPKDGVNSVVTAEDLEQNLDDKGGKRKVKPPTAVTVPAK
jgi:type 1 glutamine amidotransferase